MRECWKTLLSKFYNQTENQEEVRMSIVHITQMLPSAAVSFACLLFQLLKAHSKRRNITGMIFFSNAKLQSEFYEYDFNITVDQIKKVLKRHYRIFQKLITLYS